MGGKGFEKLWGPTDGVPPIVNIWLRHWLPIKIDQNCGSSAWGDEWPVSGRVRGGRAFCQASGREVVFVRSSA